MEVKAVFLECQAKVSFLILPQDISLAQIRVHSHAGWVREDLFETRVILSIGA